MGWHRLTVMAVSGDGVACKPAATRLHPARLHTLCVPAATAPRQDENWRMCYKALLLLEHLIKHGPGKIVGDVQVRWGGSHTWTGPPADVPEDIGRSSSLACWGMHARPAGWVRFWMGWRALPAAACPLPLAAPLFLPTGAVQRVCAGAAAIL